MPVVLLPGLVSLFPPLLSAVLLPVVKLDCLVGACAESDKSDS